MKKILLAVGISSALLFGGCIALPTNRDGSVVLPPVIEDIVAASEATGEDQVNALITEGVKWVDGSVSTLSGGGVGLAGLVYLGRLLWRSKKKASILFESMDDDSKERAKTLAKYTAVEKEIA